MTKPKFFSINLDSIGFSASALCAVHCALLPFVFTIPTLGGLAWLHNPFIEGSLLAVAIVMASWSLVGSYKKHHHNIRPLVLATIGFVFLVLSVVFHHGIAHHIMTVLGGSLIAYSHFVNWQLLRSCNQCQGIHPHNH